LLHAVPTEGGGVRADIVNQNFYLTNRKPLNPAAELAATINGFSEKSEDAIALRCRFQARFYWLNKQLPGKFDHLKNADCPRFDTLPIKSFTRKITSTPPLNFETCGRIN